MEIQINSGTVFSGKRLHTEYFRQFANILNHDVLVTLHRDECELTIDGDSFQTIKQRRVENERKQKSVIKAEKKAKRRFVEPIRIPPQFEEQEHKKLPNRLHKCQTERLFDTKALDIFEDTQKTPSVRTYVQDVPFFNSLVNTPRAENPAIRQIMNEFTSPRNSLPVYPSHQQASQYNVWNAFNFNKH